MKKTISASFFCDSKKWPRRMPIIKKLTQKILKQTKTYFKKNTIFKLNLILSEKKRLIALNKKYKNKSSDTDVLTFISKNFDKELGKISYCDIFFSIDTIEKFVKKNNVNFYDHLNHLIVHSILHINGYNHISLKQFNRMKKEEIKILKKIGINNPYL